MHHIFSITISFFSCCKTFWVMCANSFFLTLFYLTDQEKLSWYYMYSRIDPSGHSGSYEVMQHFIYLFLHKCCIWFNLSVNSFQSSMTSVRCVQCLYKDCIILWFCLGKGLQSKYISNPQDNTHRTHSFLFSIVHRHTGVCVCIHTQ